MVFRRFYLVFSHQDFTNTLQNNIYTTGKTTIFTQTTWLTIWGRTMLERRRWQMRLLWQNLKDTNMTADSLFMPPTHTHTHTHTHTLLVEDYFSYKEDHIHTQWCSHQGSPEGHIVPDSLWWSACFSQTMWRPDCHHAVDSAHITDSPDLCNTRGKK